MPEKIALLIVIIVSVAMAVGFLVAEIRYQKKQDEKDEKFYRSSNESGKLSSRRKSS